jgi:hypothetical protein
MRLFHVSEEPDITVFHPRPASAAWPGLEGRFVWAIEEELLANYLFPRECPRICLRAVDTSNPADMDALMAGERTPLILLDERWAPRVERSRLFVYEFRPDDFRLLHACAGYWVAETMQYPVGCEVVDDALRRIRMGGVRVEIRAELGSFAAAVVKSSLRYSIIRMTVSDSLPVV